MGDIGIKVSQKGYDVNTCPDYRLLYSSSWPLLEIYAEGSFEIENMDEDVTVFNHDLGYAPVFSGFIVSNTESKNSHSIEVLRVDEDNLVWLGATGLHWGGSATLYYFIYRNSLETNFTSDIIETSSESPATGEDFGFKISKDGSDAGGTDMKDFTIHSSAMSLQIQKIITGDVDWLFHEEISHSLGYTPLFFYYFKSGGYWFLVSGGNQELKGTSWDEKVAIWGIPSGTYSVVIFKDPYTLG